MGFCPSARNSFLVLLASALVFSLPALDVNALCSSSLDCPEPSCAGSLSLCVNGLCRQTPCLFEKTPANSSLDAFRPYEKSFNASLLRESGDFSSGLLGAFGITDIFSGLGISLAIIFSAFLAVFLLVFLKSKSKVMFALGLAFILLIVALLVVSAFTGQNLLRKVVLFGPSEWDSERFSDLGVRGWSLRNGFSFSESPLSREELLFAGSGAKRGVSYALSSEESQISLSVLEFYSRNAVETINPSLLSGSFIARLIDSEVVFYSVASSYSFAAWDEDRFVFLMRSSDSFSDDSASYSLARHIINSYPEKPSLSRLPVPDREPPFIRVVSPEDGSLIMGYEVKASIVIHDSLSGLDMNSLEISLDSPAGYSSQLLRADSVCEPLSPSESDSLSVPEGSLLCSWDISDSSSYSSGDLNPSEGINRLSFSVRDRSGNTASEDVSFIIDRQEPLVKIFPPESEILQQNAFAIYFDDSLSGINLSSVSVVLNGDALPVGQESCSRNARSDLFPSEPVPSSNDYWLCSYSGVLEPGLNRISVEAGDVAGNLRVVSFALQYDAWAPVVSVVQNGNSRLVFNVTDAGLGVPIDGVQIHPVGVLDFSPARDCVASSEDSRGNSLFCSLGIPSALSSVQSFKISATDRAGLSSVTDVNLLH
ncbi:hypothetical protein D6764_02130 [Candidatus Woesearchaeota archaeon]|nr:MAG: hypothetical protein D6764_02130 [Candidatus Woesearchaeota archaeon]